MGLATVTDAAARRTSAGWPSGTAVNSEDTHYAGDVNIKGKSNYPGGRDGNLYASGAQRNIATFHEQVTSGRFDYGTVAPSERSNLTTILGRTAALKSAEFTWDNLMRSEEKLDPQLEGLRE